MAQPQITKQTARATKRAIEQALKKGYPPPGEPVPRGGVGALAAAADAMGMPRPSMPGRLKAIERMGLGPDWSKYEPADLVVETIPGQFGDLRDEVKSLRKRIKELEKQEGVEEAVLRTFGKLNSTPADPPGWSVSEKSTGAQVVLPITMWSDWHAGESVSLAEVGVNEFNSSILERRVRRLVETTIHLIKNHGPGDKAPGLILLLGGDMVSGGIHEELRDTDDATPFEASLHVRDLLVWGINKLHEAFGRLYIPAVAGNHGRDSHKPRYKGTVYHNWDWAISQMVAKEFTSNKDIVFDIPAANEVAFNVFGRTHLLLHGDQIGARGGDGHIGPIGPIMRGAMKVRQQQASLGRKVEKVWMGHYHQTQFLPGVVVNNTLKGYDEFAAKALRVQPTPPSQVLAYCTPRHGIISCSEVFVEDMPDAPSRKWGKG